MILINLLPHREAARKKRKDDFNVAMGMAALVGLLIIGVGYLWFEMQISAQQDLNFLLKSEIKKLEDQIKEIDKLEDEIAAMRARQQAVEDLQSDRNQPVYLLSELTRLTPEGVQIKVLKQENQTVLIQGAAQSQERVSELLRALGNDSKWFTKPDLVEIIAGTVNLGQKETRKVFNYAVRFQILKSSDIKKAEEEKAKQAAQLANTKGAPPVAKPAAKP